MENNRLIRIDIDENISVYTRVALEGQDAKGKEVLVKALYDMPKLLNNKNKGDEVLLDCIQFNSFRITKWMVQAYLTGKYSTLLSPNFIPYQRLQPKT